MAYKRRRTTMRSRRPTRSYRKGIMSNRRTGGYATQERKFYDTERSAITLVANTFAGGELDPVATLSISSPAGGSGESAHIGRTYSLLSCLIRGIIYRSAVTTPDANPIPDGWVRLVLFLDTQTNGIQAAAENVITSATNRYLGFQNLENTTRFKVLKDFRVKIPSKTTTVGNAATYTCPLGQIPFQFGYKFRMPLKVRTASTVEGVTGVSDYSVHLMGCTHTAASTVVDWAARVRFLDN